MEQKKKARFTIATSYYGNPLLTQEAALVGISNSSPKGYAIEGKLTAVCPEWELVKAIKDGNIQQSQYVRQYKLFLDSVDKDALRKEVAGIFRRTGKTSMVLLCYEAPPIDGIIPLDVATMPSEHFCHRHILARWLSEAIQELPNRHRQVADRLAAEESVANSTGATISDPSMPLWAQHLKKPL